MPLNDRIWGSGDELCLLLDIEVSGHLHPLAILPLVKVIQVLIEQEDGWILEPECMLWREENSLAPPRNRTMIPQSCSP